MITSLPCQCDVLNPCYDKRSKDVMGKHWGLGAACPACTVVAQRDKLLEAYKDAMLKVNGDNRAKPMDILRENAERLIKAIEG